MNARIIGPGWPARQTGVFAKIGVFGIVAHKNAFPGHTPPGKAFVLRFSVVDQKQAFTAALSEHLKGPGVIQDVVDDPFPRQGQFIPCLARQ